MSKHISSLVSIDSRSIYQRLRRKDAWDLADAWKVSYPAGAPLEDMIKILEANSVNPLAKPPEGDGLTFETILVTDENGHQKRELYPVRKDHATANKDIEYQTRLDNIADKRMDDERAEAKAKEDAAANEIAELKAMVAQLMEGKTIDISAEKVTDNKIGGGSSNFSAMGWQELRKTAKAAGIKLLPAYKKADLIRMLEEQ